MEVYEFAEDSMLILRHIKDYAKEKSVLDMGTGSGVLAEEALKYTNDVTAADINPKAIEAASQRLGEKVKVLHSDLFLNISGSFDLILFNPPYLPRAKYGTVATDGGEKGFEVIKDFLADAKQHLNKNGVILLICSSFTKKQDVEWALDKLGYGFKEIDQEPLFFETLYLYEIR